MAGAKYIYLDLLNYFATEQDKLFIAITAPPVTEDNSRKPPENARALNNGLVNEWLAREVVRRVQMARKNADFAIDDKIEIIYDVSDRLSAAIDQFADYIQSETLAESLEQGVAGDGFYSEDFTPDRGDLIGEKIVIGVKRIS